MNATVNTPVDNSLAAYDKLSGALVKANEIEALHKGPVDTDFLKNDVPANIDRTGVNSAGDVGE